MKKHTTDELINKLRLNKLESEYGTPEYWAKERRSKFIINARQKDLLNRRLEFGILNLWSLTKAPDMPLYRMIDITNGYKPMTQP